MDKYYKEEGAVRKRPDCSFLFGKNSDKISVDIPMEGVEYDGWKIFPLAAPYVSNVLFHTISLIGTKLLHL